MNSLEDYYHLYINDSDITEQVFQSSIELPTSQRWLTSQPTLAGKGKLIYLTSVRVSADERNTLICLLDTSWLTRMIEDVLTYEQFTTYVCLSDGTVLYTNSHGIENYPSPAAFLQERQNSGKVIVQGNSYAFSRVSCNHGLTYISAIPVAVINAPLQSLWRGFYIALAITAALGIAGIILLMKLNWLPIKQLHEAVVGRSDHKSDSIKAVQQAFLGMQANVREIS